MLRFFHFRKEEIHQHLQESLLPRQLPEGLRLEIPFTWLLEAAWAAAAAAVNVSVCCTCVCVCFICSVWIQLISFTGWRNVSRCLSVGLEDSTTDTVAEAVISVLRGCLEHMPKGE